MIRRIQELQREYKGLDRWRWAIWLEGFPINLVQWLEDRLLRLRNRAEALVKGNIKTVVKVPAGKGRLRRKPHQSVFNQVRQWQARQAVLEWSIAIGVGAVAPTSIYTLGSSAAKAFSKAMGAAQPPDPSLEIEKISFARLHNIVTSASANRLAFWNEFNVARYSLLMAS